MVHGMAWPAEPFLLCHTRLRFLVYAGIHIFVLQIGAGSFLGRTSDDVLPLHQSVNIGDP